MNAAAVAQVRTLVEQGETVNKATKTVSAQYKVTQRTIQTWLTKANVHLGTIGSEAAANARACARVQRAARIEEGLALLADALPALARKVAHLEGRDADGTVRACRGILEMVRLVEGEATSRVEHMGKDEFMAEVDRLIAQVDAQPV